MVEPIFDYQFRLILVGDSMVGKSSLLTFFTDGRFEKKGCDPTVGVDFFARLVEVKPGVKVKLQLWDTAGQERFRSITKTYYRNAVGCILVYDISKRSSFDHMEEWIQEARMNIEPQKAVYMLVGHKADEEATRAVTVKEGKYLADFHSMRFLETSALTGQNVEETFLTITRDIYRLLEEGQVCLEDDWGGIKEGYAHPRDSVYLSEDNGGGGGCC